MDLRNIAIIAHVDHGKTTLVDELLKQSGAFRANQAVAERAMDSNDLERERGITILAKATSVEWHGHRINIVDTPGHADFGGEVERILSMVDGVVLLVDAAEGPMPQTKFVTSKALALGLRPIVVLNKVDKPDAEPDRALDECFDLFVALGADEDQLDFPHMYASGRSGWADAEMDGPRKNLDALFQLIINHVPAPKQLAKQNDDFRMLATTLGNDPFVGRILTGRVESGRLKVGQTIQALSRVGQKIEQFRVTKIQAFRGLGQQDIDEAIAGDIVSLAGMTKATVSDTLCALAVEEPLEAQPIDPPTITVTFGINDSPLAGREGKKVQSRVIRERLMKEAESNVAIKVTDTPGGEAFEVAGRGELQMGVLIENMRREGFELSISRPQVLMREENGQRMEPIEEVTIDVDDDYSGEAVAYALWNLEERGRMFLGPQAKIYQGMIIGEHSRDNDLEVNPLKGKKLTNVRASGTDDAVRLTPHINFSLEEAIAYINDDELVEVTPESIRLRKRYLDPHERKRMSKQN
ncbi:MAG: GTP-binding protein, partial [Rhodobacteraceae bacterium]|nr:GTP-binding protein [Paracoccaceae bacterium]